MDIVTKNISLYLGTCDDKPKHNLGLDSIYFSMSLLRLWNNKLGDSGVELLSVALREPTCKIEELQ